MAGALPPPLSPAALERSARVRDRIRRECERAGILPFDRFVELSLYDPADGYYAQPELRLGRQGDFYTAAHVHPIFGRTVARRVLSEQQRLGHPPSFQVHEVGAGDGTLAGDIREAWSDAGASDHPFEHVLIDIPGPRLVGLGERLGTRGGAIGELRISANLGDRGPFRGVVLANELLDAMPFRRLVRRASVWRELGVGIGDGGLAWAETDLVRPVGPPDLPDLPEGSILEISEAAEGWIRQAADLLVDGAILVMDYGAEESDGVWSQSRGTLSAVREHRGGVDPLEAPGTADLSAFVDFTRIRAAAARAGLREVAYRSQSEALGAWGFEGILAAAIAGARSSEQEVRIRLAAKNLLFGFERFRVLELAPRATGATT